MLGLGNLCDTDTASALCTRAELRVSVVSMALPRHCNIFYTHIAWYNMLDISSYADHADDVAHAFFALMMAISVEFVMLYQIEYAVGAA